MRVLHYIQRTTWVRNSALVILFLAAGIFFPGHSFAQATPTNDIKNKLITNPDTATIKGYIDKCMDSRTGIAGVKAGGCELKSADGIDTKCVTVGNSCTLTAPDKSNYVASANLVIGEQVKNYDSAGNLVGSTDSGGYHSAAGTLQNTTLGQEAITPSCSAAHIDVCFNNMANSLVAGIGYVILVFSSWILGVCGVLFNWTVVRTVFQFASYFGNSSGMLVSWGVLRDIGNIVLLFGFIFLGVATILNVSTHGHSASSNIPRLILFALLLNFSLLAAEAVIDTSNAFGSVFASQAGVICTSSSAADNNSCANLGISGKAVALVGLSSAWQAPIKLDGSTDIAQTITTYFGGSLFLIVLAVVLLAASIMLATRAVVLCILIITSPIGFAGMVIPPLESLAKTWWKTLFSQAFFAPVLILCILVSLKVGDGLSNGASLIDALRSENSDALQVVLVFVIIIGLLIASLMVAKKMGAMGADFAIKTAGGAVFGTVGFAGRRTVGMGSAFAAQSIAKSKFGRTNTGRFFYGIANKGATSSFDPRSSKLIGGIAKGSKLDFGKTNVPHGIHDIEEKAVKARTEYATKLKQTDAEAAREGSLKSRKKTLEAGKKKAEVEWEAEKDRLNEDIAKAEATGTKDEVAALKREKAEAEKLRKDRIRNINKSIERTDAEILTVNGDSVKRAYAESMEHGGLPWPTVDSHANHEAATKILKDVNKTKNERLFDTIKDSLDKAGGEASKKSDEIKEAIHEGEADHATDSHSHTDTSHDTHETHVG